MHFLFAIQPASASKIVVSQLTLTKSDCTFYPWYDLSIKFSFLVFLTLTYKTFKLEHAVKQDLLPQKSFRMYLNKLFLKILQVRCFLLKRGFKSFFWSILWEKLNFKQVLLLALLFSNFSQLKRCFVIVVSEIDSSQHSRLEFPLDFYRDVQFNFKEIFILYQLPFSKEWFHALMQPYYTKLDHVPSEKLQNRMPPTGIAKIPNSPSLRKVKLIELKIQVY